MIRLRPLYAVATIAWTAVVLIVNGTPAERLPRTGLWLLRFPHADKMVHFGMYAVMAALAYKALADARDRQPVWFVAIIAAAVAMVGALDELHQAIVPGRSMDPLDWLADAAGAVAAVITMRVLASHLAPGYLRPAPTTAAPTDS